MDEKGATIVAGLDAPIGDAADRRAMPIYLITLSGTLPGAMTRVPIGSNAVGRSEDCAIQLPDRTISRHHALIRADEQGNAQLIDLKSSNGTFHNGRRLIPNEPTILGDGDKIRFGTNLVVKFARPDSFEEQFQREMFERSVRDPLTGLYHRAYFLDQAAIVAQRAETKGLGLAILMVDIDHFKRVNDQFGHDVGDSVLREVASTIRQSTRPEDLVARFGGEEFIAALPIATPDQASERAERIRWGLAQRPITIAGNVLRITASIGLAFSSAGWPRPVSNLVSSADRSLYQAKRSGRDRVSWVSEVAALCPMLTTIDE